MCRLLFSLYSQEQRASFLHSDTRDGTTRWKPQKHDYKVLISELTKYHIVNELKQNCYIHPDDYYFLYRYITSVGNNI